VPDYASGSDAQPAPREGGDTEARQSKARREQNATPSLLLKHSDATLATYIRRQMKHTKYASETLAETPDKHLKTM
jgi:hypothetical protein